MVITIRILKKAAFQAYGVKWQGSFKQAGNGEIRVLLDEFRTKCLQNHMTFDSIYGISVHDVPNGFTYYICVEGHVDSSISNEFKPFHFQAHQFAALDFQGQAVQQAYQKLYNWVESNHYQLAQDTLNQFEVYPKSYRPLHDEPDLTIMVPITN